MLNYTGALTSRQRFDFCKWFLSRLVWNVEMVSLHTSIPLPSLEEALLILPVGSERVAPLGTLARHGMAPHSRPPQSLVMHVTVQQNSFVTSRT